MIKQLAITAGAAVATAGAATAGAAVYEANTGIADARATVRDAHANEEDGRGIGTVASIPADARERALRPDALVSALGPGVLAGVAALGTGHLLKLGPAPSGILASAVFVGTTLLRGAMD